MHQPYIFYRFDVQFGFYSKFTRKNNFLVEQQNGNEIETLEEFKVDRVLDAHDYFLEYLFPDAILYGMSYEEFWNKSFKISMLNRSYFN